ncbi:FUSC family protein [Polaribacter sp. BAL334]|uniref:FUSC family protein n=1 Tax=Polaribacter sp. BAL334 TaxID=1708178 RepID=UPI0018D268F7|nr:FUSC family protein [Polaribacter sp. BAL334]MBG7613154.1 FUSC family protein [Polaribacter sp. BAL334]
MKKVVTIIAFVSAIIALIFSFLPVYIIAYYPAIVAALFCGILWKINQKSNTNSTTFKVLVFLIIASLSITSYRVFFTTSEVSDTKNIQQKEQQSEEEAIEELEGLELEE